MGWGGVGVAEGRGEGKGREGGLGRGRAGRLKGKKTRACQVTGRDPPLTPPHTPHAALNTLTT